MQWCEFRTAISSLQVSEGESPAVDDSDAVRAIDWDLRLVAAIDSDQVVAVNSDVTVGAADDSDRMTAVSLDITMGAADG